MPNFVNLLDIVYPVGSIYFSTSSVSPASSVGGTWTQLKTFLYGSTTAKKTGGEATHKLTVNEMPVHTHAQNVTANSGGPALRCDYSADARGLIYPQGISTGEMGWGSSAQQLATLYDLLHLVSYSVAALKANSVNLSEVAYV